MASEQSDQLTDGTIIGNRFKVVQKLGEGGCGSVFKVEDQQDKNKLCALKVEFSNGSVPDSILKMEVQILEALKPKKHMVKLIASAKRPEFSYMVMTLLGESLMGLVDKHGPFLNVSTQTRIAIMLLFGIKQIHDIGYIHRDLKPANIALGYKGTEEERFFMILDFGLARQYVSKTESGKLALRRPRDRALFRGTSRYCSIAMHDRTEQGRVDDLWALTYMFAELRCKLPWAETYEKDDIAILKRETLDDQLFKNSPVQFLEFVKEVRKLNYYDRPDYEKLYKILNGIMKEANYKWSDPYHWELQTKKGRKSRDNSTDTTCTNEPRKPKNKKKFSFSERLLKSSRNRKSPAKKNEGGSTRSSRTKTKALTFSPAGTASDTPVLTNDDFTSNPIGF